MTADDRCVSPVRDAKRKRDIEQNSRRKRAPERAGPKLETLERTHLGILEDYPQGVVRPMTRGDCADVPRPCPFVSCKWNLYLDVESGGRIRLNFPDIEPDEMDEERSCALDIADGGGATLVEIGAVLNITRERSRQIENIGLALLQQHSARSGLADYEGHVSVRVSMIEHMSDEGGGGSGPREDRANTHGGAVNRNDDLDEDALFCERVYGAYDRAIRYGAPVKGAP